MHISYTSPRLKELHLHKTQLSWGTYHKLKVCNLLQPDVVTKRGKRAGVRRSRKNDNVKKVTSSSQLNNLIAGTRKQNNISVRITNNQKRSGKKGQGYNHRNVITVNEQIGLNVCLLNPTSVCNKTTQLHDFILTHCLDLVFITETWLTGTSYDDVIKTELLPPGYHISDIPRVTAGGGVAIVHRASVPVNCYPTGSYKSFEVLGVKIKSNNRHVIALVLYRPPPSQKNRQTFTQFKTDFKGLMELLRAEKTPFVIYGDFNIHVENTDSNREAVSFTDILNSFGVDQHVTHPTHDAGHTLDLILTAATDHLVDNINVYDCGFPGHFPVFSCLSVTQQPSKTHRVTYRKLNRINIDQFRSDVCEAFPVANIPTCRENINELVQQYDQSLSSILEKHAPLKTRNVPERKEAEWYTDDIRVAKQHRRQLERLWRKTRLEVHRQMYRTQCIQVNLLIEHAKRDHYTTLIQGHENDTKALFRVVDSLLGRSRRSALPSGSSLTDTAEQLGQFFQEKVAKIAIDLQHAAYTDPTTDVHGNPPLMSTWTFFNLTSPEEVMGIIKNSPNKSCSLDPLPTSLLKSCTTDLAPAISNIINASLRTGTFPTAFKHALVTPLLKKPSLDAELLSNYRPVSNLAFLSKVLEKVVAARLKLYLHQNDLAEAFQSAYRQSHSTETALLKIKEDIVTAIGNRKAVFLILLDLSAAFDTINHAKLLDILSRMGINGTVLSWFSSYLVGRKQSIICADARSSSFELGTGVPQGSVLGPILFNIYTTSLGQVLSRLGVSYHFYADDTQIYLSFDPLDEATAVETLKRCVSVVRQWMGSHHLKMNDSKTEAMVFGNARVISKLKNYTIPVGNQDIIPQSSAKSLGFVFDDKMTMQKQVTNQCRNAYMHIRSLSRIKPFLPQECLETLVHAFISSKLDYCNSLYLGASKCVLDKLQSVQNSAARLVKCTRKHDRITPVLYHLHWLPVHQRIKYKVLLTIYKAQHGDAPIYISNLFKNYLPSRDLRSSDSEMLQIPFTRSSTIRDTSLSHAGPQMWNLLPISVRKSPTVNCFKSALKTFLFREHFN